MAAGPYSIGSSTWPGLGKALEESGELAQVLGKLIASAGDPEHWDGTNLRDRLANEIADTQAALDFFLAHNDLPTAYICERRERKAAQFAEWHRNALNEHADVDRRAD